MEPVKLTRDHLDALNRHRQLIVNEDTNPDYEPYVTEGITPDQLVEYAFSFFDTGPHHIDSVFWSFGEGDSAVYPSTVLPTKDFPTFHRWRADGIDIVRRFVNETRKRDLEVFISCRMNGADPGENLLPTSGKFSEAEYRFLPQKRAHMDWLIRAWTVDPGQPDPEQREDCIWLWNYARPEVREYKLDVLRELAEKYDLDGLELDFARLPPHLPLEHQWEHRHVLTEFVRTVRSMTLDLEKRRNRPLLLAVRVPDNIDGAKLDGFDVETWTRELLIDLLVPGPRALEIDLHAFRRITADTPVKLYPCLDGFHAADGYGNPRPEIVRGVLANWFLQGAHGVEFFNFFNVTPEAKARYAPTLLNEWATLVAQNHRKIYAEFSGPHSLRRKSKTFVVGRRGGGFSEPWRFPLTDDWYTPRYSYFNTNMFAQLPASIDNSGRIDTILTMQVGDNVQELARYVKRIALRVLLSDPAAEHVPDRERLPKAIVRAPGTKHGPSYNHPPNTQIAGQVELRINGVLLPQPVPENGWLAVPLEPNQLAVGANLIGVRVRNRPHGAPRIQIEKVELDVCYDD